MLATLVAPALVEVGVEPIAAHLFILYFGMMSMITPPVAIAAFAAASLTGEDPMRTGFAAMRFGWLAYVIPFLFVLSPTLLMRGEASEILISAFTALAGVWLVSAGMIGYLFHRQSVVERIAFIAAGLALMIPANAVSGQFTTDIAGFALGAVLVGRQFLGRKRTSAQA